MDKPYRVKCSSCKGEVLRSTPRWFLCGNCKNQWRSPLKWENIRKAILKRDSNKCLLCGDNKNLHIHHIDKDRRNNNDRNLMTLCNQCHESQHKKNFEKPVGITFGQFGKRLIYQSDLVSKNFVTQKKRLPKKFFTKKEVK